MTKVVMIVAAEGFRDEELFDTQAVLENNGVDVDTASVGVKEAKGKLGGVAKVDLEVAAVDAKDYDGIVFVSGPGCTMYFEDPTAHELANEFFTSGKVVASICMAGSILANSDILVGRKATAYSSEKQNLIDRGAEFTGDSVTVDGNIITGNGPDAAKEFGEKIVEALK